MTESLHPRDASANPPEGEQYSSFGREGLPPSFLQTMAEAIAQEIGAIAERSLSNAGNALRVALVTLTLAGCTSPRVLQEVKGFTCTAVQAPITDGGWREWQRKRTIGTLCREGFDVVIAQQQEEERREQARQREVQQEAQAQKQIEREYTYEQQRIIQEARQIMDKFREDVERQLREIERGRRKVVEPPAIPGATLPPGDPKEHLTGFWRNPNLLRNEKVGMVIYQTGWNAVAQGSQCSEVPLFLNSKVYHPFFKKGVEDAARKYCVLAF
ncbi:MAG: hypothetical protein KatS3mg099_079 [Candidatus Parcubacteria bacterium]|nr:MAG: hypothetical protein KatS3mg099_079 [Candidatus Parcubacteria bacterium]